MQSIVFGKNSVLALLQSKRAVNQILFNQQLKRDHKVQQIINLAQQQKVKYRFVHPDQLDQMSGSGQH